MNKEQYKKLLKEKKDNFPLYYWMFCVFAGIFALKGIINVL